MDAERRARHDVRVARFAPALQTPAEGDAPSPTAASRHVPIPVVGAANPAAAARHSLAVQCRGQVPQPLIEDLQIIVSELVANVIEHGGGPDGLTIELTIRAGEVDVQVVGHGDAHQLPPFDAWRLPAATQRSGRGLALVRRLAGRVSVAGDDPLTDEPGWVRITASLPLTER